MLPQEQLNHFKLNAIAGNTSLLNGSKAATFSGSYKVSDTLGNVMKNTTTLSDHMTAGLTVLSSAPDVNFSSAVALSSNDDIKTLNHFTKLKNNKKKILIIN